ncbi:MAG: sporulation protein YqfD [Clostridia bacterium]|nr:sporulation protein YqfD [Clostridia bacterium]
MLLFIYRLLCGYLYLRISAENPEKLLNICAAKGIGIWRVTVKGNLVYFKIGITSFKKLRIFKRKVPCKIHITKR